jgi:hypothetical protein
MDQWGVGRKGIDDGLVILFELGQQDPCHGQVQLYAGPGFSGTYLTNEERQAVFEETMLPYLRACDMDQALTAGMARIDAAVTPEHAGQLTFFRQLNAVLGLIVAPLILLLVVGYGLVRWYQVGRDPVYLDDPSILMPAPPPGLTPAAGAAVRDGGVTRRALTAATLDLAARGKLGFRAEPSSSVLGGHPQIGIYTGDAVAGDPVEQARLARARSRPMDAATQYALTSLTGLGGSAAYIEPDDITKFGPMVGTFDSTLERHLVEQGWFRERPSAVIGRWGCAGSLLLVAAVIAFIAAVNIPSGGLTVVAVSLGISAIALFAISRAMPARTKQGAVVRAMLEAYRRTLEKTMAQARSMGEVAAQSAIPLIEGPDDAVVWGVALGLHEEVEAVLQRSSEDLQAGRTTGVYLPGWYLGGGPSMSSSGGPSGWAPGAMDSSAVPNFGGMMAALSTIGTSPSSSGSGSGGGGFGGGGSGGGGGGAGGGF